MSRDGYWAGAPFDAQLAEVEATTVPDEVVEPVEVETSVPAEASAGTRSMDGDEYFLSVGECINEDQIDPYLAGEDYSITPCDAPHDNEVYFVYEWPEGPYPGDAETENELDEICLDEFEGYVGTDYETSTLDVWLLLPDQQGWKYGERFGECLLYDMDGTKLTGTAQNSGW